jgi:hypothetical protein
MCFDPMGEIPLGQEWDFTLMTKPITSRGGYVINIYIYLLYILQYNLLKNPQGIGEPMA